MRIATKNQFIALMNDRAFPFAGFCLTPEGAETKFIFDNINSYNETTGFDLDLEVTQEILTTLFNHGIFDQACIDRFAAFAGSTDGVPNPARKKWRLPVGVEPSDFFTSDIWTTEYDGSGFIYVWSNGDCTHPEAMEVM